MAKSVGTSIPRTNGQRNGMSPSGPDWSQITQEVLCPLCEYNLRGIHEPRCPECGYRFAWAELLDTTRRLHPYLFEHHPERNLRSLVQTALNGLRPRRFWSSLSPSQPSNHPRLVRYWIYCWTAYLIAASLSALPAGIAQQQRMLRQGFVQNRARQRELALVLARQPLTPVERQFYQQELQELRTHAPAGPSLLPIVMEAAPASFGLAMRTGLALMLWPWVTLASLMIFRWSMRRAKIQNIHVLRCCLYSFDGQWWLGLVLFLGNSWTLLLSPRMTSDPAGWLVALPVAFGMLKLWRAYRFYLRFDRPLATIVASQIIVMLFMLFLWQLIDDKGPVTQFYDRYIFRRSRIWSL